MKTKSKQRLPTVHTLPNRSKSDIINTRAEAELQVKKDIGARIKQKRRSTRKFLTAAVVAQKLGISRVALTQLENGQNNVNGVTLWKLATILGCGVQEFFPEIPPGFELSKEDIKNISKQDQNAVKYAEDCFGPAKK